MTRLDSTWARAKLCVFLPLLASAGVVAVVAALAPTGEGGVFELIAQLAVMVAVLAWLFKSGPRTVSLGGNILRVSGRNAQEDIPLTDVDDVSYVPLLFDYLAPVRFRRTTRFGRSIVFLPMKRYGDAAHVRAPAVEPSQRVIAARWVAQATEAFEALRGRRIQRWRARAKADPGAAELIARVVLDLELLLDDGRRVAIRTHEDECEKTHGLWCAETDERLSEVEGGAWIGELGGLPTTARVSSVDIRYDAAGNTSDVTLGFDDGGEVELLPGHVGRYPDGRFDIVPGGEPVVVVSSPVDVRQRGLRA